MDEVCHDCNSDCSPECVCWCHVDASCLLYGDSYMRERCYACNVVCEPPIREVIGSPHCVPCFEFALQKLWVHQ